ncbi:TBC1 domain family member 2b [Biomphalaria glabrata]|uniref:Transmembrane protein 272-like n=1 Tax=Biomphalaria glabrata TaxID=6526 RepID=A0A2C9M200_BIOGL|nr:transmembrane protein 272-like [Biomphalaria glabrata]KAI8757082.1 hypothetical protein BgiMline_010597 [Biomphalaria glabrata]KAI8798547.1 hypothetical protein BgiBS90_000850 [Biomphalaria glabrata]
MDNRQIFSASMTSSQSGLSLTSNTTSEDVKWADQETSTDFIEALKDLTKDSESTFEFVVGANEIVCGTLIVNVFLACLMVFCVVEAGTGVKYLSECPENPNIPVFLFVGGCFGTLKTIHTMYGNYKVKKHNQNSMTSHRSDEIVDITLNVFLLVWQGLGTYWTFSVWYPLGEEPLDADPRQWCNQELYFFAVVQCGLVSILIVILVLMHCGFAFCFKCTNCFR